MAWSSGHTGLRPVVMYVCEWRPSRRVDMKERSCSFLEMDEQKLPFTVSVTCCWHEGPFFCACWGRQPLLQTERQGCWQGLLLITKIGSSEDIYNGIDKIALPRCFVCNSRCVWRIFLHTSMKWSRTTSAFHLSMHVRRHTGCHGYKMAPVVAARARRRSVCRRLLRLSRKICLMFAAATVFNFGRESVHLCKWNISNWISGGTRHVFAWRWLDFGAYGPPLHRKVCNWMGSSKRGDKTGRSCSFLEMNE